jgi:hypothetical protein
MFLFTIKRGIFIALMCASLLQAVPEIIIHWHDDPANITAWFHQREDAPLVQQPLTFNEDRRLFYVVYPWGDRTQQLEVYRIATRERILSVRIRETFSLRIRPVASGQPIRIELVVNPRPDIIVHTETVLPPPVDDLVRIADDPVRITTQIYAIRRTYTFM